MANNNELKGKVVLISGGSSGIGKATAEVFLSTGAVVHILGRNRKRLEAAIVETPMVNEDFRLSAHSRRSCSVDPLSLH